jgi:hypothetical protein
MHAAFIRGPNTALPNPSLEERGVVEEIIAVK